MMATTIFIRFPDNESSLIEVGDEHSRYTLLVDESVRLLNFIANSKSNVSIIHEEANITKFRTLAGQLIDSETYLTTPINLLRTKLKKVASRSWRAYPCLKKDAHYFLWEYDSFSHDECIDNGVLNNEILAEIAEQIFQNPSNDYLLFDLSYASFKRKFLPVFKDCWHHLECPQFAHINFVTTFTEFELWWKTKDFPFSLLDRKRFELTNEIQQGAKVYKELDTNYFWYLDNFHNTHYEIFDGNRNHIGEADLKGVLDISKKKKGRTF